MIIHVTVNQFYCIIATQTVNRASFLLYASARVFWQDSISKTNNNLIIQFFYSKLANIILPVTVFIINIRFRVVNNEDETNGR